MTQQTDLLRRAAEMLRGFVKTYEQVSEDEPGCYCSDEDAEMDGVALSLLALADQMERAEPVAWQVLRVAPDYSALETAKICDSLEEAKRVRYDLGAFWASTRQLYTHPAPEVTRDAERLDWLERVQPIIFCPHEEDGDWVIYPDANLEQSFDGKTLRQAVDIARAAMQEPKP